jgi:DNA-binding Lrp family transcriptional regulator
MEQILRALQRDARLTPAEIAAETGRNEEEVRALIAEAEARQLILSYGAKVNWEAAGRARIYALVEMKVHPQERVGYKAIAGRVSRFGAVRTCYLMSGEKDLAVIVEGETMHEISDFVGEKLATLPGVESTVTHVIMRRHKEDGVMLDAAPDEDRQAVVL